MNDSLFGLFAYNIITIMHTHLINLASSFNTQHIKVNKGYDDFPLTSVENEAC